MSRVNTVSVQFDASAPEIIRNVDVHLFCKDKLGLAASDVLGLQLEYGTVRRFYVKLCSVQKCDELVSRNSGLYQFKHQGGSVTSVTLRHADGLGLRAVRVVNLPLEFDNKVIEQALRPYGTIKSLKMEVWSGEGMLFKVPNGVRVLHMELDKHIPSFISFPKHGKQQVFYQGQPRTCSVCDELDHMRAKCPRTRKPGQPWRIIPPVNKTHSGSSPKGSVDQGSADKGSPEKGSSNESSADSGPSGSSSSDKGASEKGSTSGIGPGSSSPSNQAKNPEVAISEVSQQPPPPGIQVDQLTSLHDLSASRDPLNMDDDDWDNGSVPRNIVRVESVLSHGPPDNEMETETSFKRKLDGTDAPPLSARDKSPKQRASGKNMLKTNVVS